MLQLFKLRTVAEAGSKTQITTRPFSCRAQGGSSARPKGAGNTWREQAEAPGFEYIVLHRLARTSWPQPHKPHNHFDLSADKSYCCEFITLMFGWRGSTSSRLFRHYFGWSDLAFLDRTWQHLYFDKQNYPTQFMLKVLFNLNLLLDGCVEVWPHFVFGC